MENVIGVVRFGSCVLVLMDFEHDNDDQGNPSLVVLFLFVCSHVVIRLVLIV